MKLVALAIFLLAIGLSTCWQAAPMGAHQMNHLTALSGMGLGPQMGAGAARVLSGMRGQSQPVKNPSHPNPTLMYKPNYANSLNGELREKFFEGMHPLEKIQYLSLRRMTGFKSNFHLEEVEPEYEPVATKKQRGRSSSRTLAAKKNYDELDFFDYDY